jgi:enoyl-CoA hydratase
VLSNFNFMSDTPLQFEIDEPLATITFNRPAARNALTWEMYDGIMHACDIAERNDSIRVVILRGAGNEAFAAGTDISQFESFSGARDGLAYERKLEAALGRLEALNKPTIAAVEGFAVGAGAAIAIVCDLRYGGASSKIGVPISRTLGNCLSVANYARLLDLLGPSRTKEIMFRGTLISADEASAAGLLNEVVKPGSAFARAREVALEIAANAPITISVTKEALRRIQLHRRAVDGDDLVARAYASADFHEGVAAFIARRKPRFTGR